MNGYTAHVYPQTEDHRDAGITKREYYAAKLLAAMLSLHGEGIVEWEHLANAAVSGSDALVKALSVPHPTL